ncbi:hypothetical protein Pmani_014035 [Petrolisthes manimaculis]|uniref:Cadherin domain-containing protein n=1 Tax=Petrolisthes manimaculis TaxID=1843537 RepID=A0AAE1PUE7_9EUCA|nr:hypothetical protein Pmani_014035 [Petrolisthes manimaculis]
MCRLGWVALLVGLAWAAGLVEPVAPVPLFYEADKMSALRLPYDTEPNKLIYRLRAYNAQPNRPLAFDVHGRDADMISITSVDDYGLVYLRQTLTAGRNYTFVLTVREKLGVNPEDSTTEVIGRIIPTRGRTPLSDIFLSYSSSEVIPEVSHRDSHVTRAWHQKRPPTLCWACVTRPP